MKGIFNIGASLTAQKNLRTASQELSKTYERLSSGLRINGPVDDAAGLALATELQVDARVYTQATRNINDGISLLSVAEAALQNLLAITQRQQELAEQAGNEMYTATQRNALAEEADALTEEFNRIVRTTEFNSLSLLDRKANEYYFSIQAGKSAGDAIAANTADALSRVVGSGTYQSATSYLSFAYTGGSADLFDVTGDGVTDLLSLGYSADYTAGNYGQYAVNVGSANGSFGATVTYNLSAKYVEGIAAAYLDGDSKMDLVIVGRNSSNALDYTQILIGNGNGTFSLGTSYYAFSSGSHRFGDVSLADINNDGKVDMVASGYNATEGWAMVRLGAGNGTFGAASTFTTESLGSLASVLADVNNDEILDLITAGQADGPAGQATIHLGNGDGTFRRASQYSTEGYHSVSLSIDDVNRDGYVDLITGGRDGGGTSYATVRLGTGGGTFAATAVTYLMAHQGSTLLDLNGDGLKDLISDASNGSNGGIYYRLGAADGTFGTAVTQGFFGEALAGGGLLIEDRNHDGAMDIIGAGYGVPSNQAFGFVLTAAPDRVTTAPYLNLRSAAEALSSLTTLQTQHDRISAELGAVGASQSRLSHAFNFATVARENLNAATGNILDADVAEETAKLVKFQILQQAATAMLAQVNQTSNVVLKLLMDE